MRTGASTLLMAMAVITGCRDDDPPSPPNGGTAWSNHITLSVDSACVQAPNVITPNHDASNDVFAVLSQNVVSIQTLILRANGTVVLNSNSLWPIWSDADSTDLGRYRVFVHAISTSGITLSGWSYLDVLDYGANMCLYHDGTPVTGDQLDPRICGVTYPTTEVFCP